MGASPWVYFVPYQSDVAQAFETLREREFTAGRYYPAMEELPVVIDPSVEGPGCQHPSIRDAFRSAGACGTRSILDMVGTSEEAEICTVSPLEDEILIDLYETEKPTYEQVRDLQALDSLDRLQGCYVIVYREDKPDQIMFAGYSAD